MSTRWTRVARGTLAAGLSTFVAAFSHAAAGGSAPSIAALSLAIAFSILGVVVLNLFLAINHRSDRYIAM